MRSKATVRPRRGHRRSMILRVAGSAAAAIVISSAGVPASAQDMSWASGVREDGWGDGRVVGGGEMIIFRRAAEKGPEGYARLQLRYEYRDGSKVGGVAYLSMLALDEFDCKGGRFRNLRVAVFTRHNAEGENRQEAGPPGAWEKPAAGTVDATSLAQACGTKR